MITEQQLRAIMPFGAKRGVQYLAPLAAAMAEFEINTPARQAAFIAQLAHESGEFRYVRELASGDAYEGRKDLGNTEPGDGVRFRGRGLIQITGRANYRACSAALFEDPDFLLNDPAVLEQPGPACRSAAWFWKTRGLNELADAGDFARITKRINGGYNGQAEREQYHARAQVALGAA
jgi:putative chitinase